MSRGTNDTHRNSEEIALPVFYHMPLDMAIGSGMGMLPTLPESINYDETFSGSPVAGGGWGWLAYLLR